jgi:hypothetical protein
MCGTTLGKLAMVTCPICKSEAEEIEPGTFDGMWFRCLKHREFGVSDRALKTRKNAEPEQSERALKKAIERAGPEERPKILDLDF